MLESRGFLNRDNFCHFPIIRDFLVCKPPWKEVPSCSRKPFVKCHPKYTGRPQNKFLIPLGRPVALTLHTPDALQNTRVFVCPSPPQFLGKALTFQFIWNSLYSLILDLSELSFRLIPRLQQFILRRVRSGFGRTWGFRARLSQPGNYPTSQEVDLTEELRDLHSMALRL